MHRSVLAATVCALMLACAPALSSAAGGHPHVNGHGEFGPPFTSNPNGDNFFDINVRSNADSSQVSGKIRVYDKSARAFYEATPICLRVVGNEASILGRITSASAGNAFASGVLINVVDNDHPKAPDLFGNILFNAGQFNSFRGSCPPPTGMGATVNKGHVEVHNSDSSPDD
jgi:hypothetical protein